MEDALEEYFKICGNNCCPHVTYILHTFNIFNFYILILISNTFSVIFNCGILLCWKYGWSNNENWSIFSSTNLQIPSSSVAAQSGPQQTHRCCLVYFWELLLRDPQEPPRDHPGEWDGWREAGTLWRHSSSPCPSAKTVTTAGWLRTGRFIINL